MSKEVEELVTSNVNLIYFVLKKLKLNNPDGINKYYDVGAIGLIKGANRYDSSLGIKPSSYLTRCIINEILHEKSKEKRTLEYDKTVSLNVSIADGLILEDVIDSGISVEKVLENEESFSELYSAIELLKEKEKFVIIHLYGLYNNEKVRQKDLAEMLGLSQSAISKITIRATKKLRGLLDGKI